MSKKPRPSLDSYDPNPPSPAKLHAVPTPPRAEPTTSTAAAPEAPVARSMARKQHAVIPSNEERIQIGFRMPLSRWKTLRGLSTDQRKSLQALYDEAMELLYKHYGMKW